MVLAFAAAADDQNGLELRQTLQGANEKDMGAGIAYAAYIAAKAGR